MSNQNMVRSYSSIIVLQLMNGVSLILDEKFQFTRHVILTNNIISVRSHQQLIETLHKIQQVLNI